MNTKPIVYWDTSVWIAIMENKTHEAIYEGASHANDKVNKGEHILVVSPLVRLEIYKTLTNDKQRSIFSDLLQRTNVHVQSINSRIIDIAFDLQLEVMGLKNGKKLNTADAIHLATAVYAEADYFYGADSHHLSLNGVLKMRKMPQIITPPVNPQGSLRFVAKRSSTGT